MHNEFLELMGGAVGVGTILYYMLKPEDKEVVPEFLKARGFAFDGVYSKTDKYVKIINAQKLEQIAPNITNLILTPIVMLAERDRETNLYRLGMRIEGRDAISPEMTEEEFALKLEDFEKQLLTPK